MAVATISMPNLNGHMNGNGYANGNGDVEMGSADVSVRFSTGLILPPPEIKSVIDKTASWVAKSANPPQFEDKIRETQRNDPKFSFLNPADPYHAYYRHRLQRVAAGEVDEPTAAEDAKDTAVVKEEAPKDLGIEPPVPEFILELPTITPQDLDIMKLTALFTAQRGRGFLASLSVKEGRNYQFDFLRPTHSLFGYFNRLVEQYARVISPSRATLARCREMADEGARWNILNKSREYAKWQKSKREREQKREDEKEAERIAFAEIDWHDYAIVQTIEFTQADAQAELPAPMSLQQVESMTLAQKRVAAMIHETAADDVVAHRQRQAAEDEATAHAAAAAEAAIAAARADAAGSYDMDEDDEAEKEAERARALGAGGSGQMKIRSDYVPKLGAKNKSATTTCTICGQQIPVDELQEHMRIELLDPRWKTQRDALEARKAQASELQRGADVVASLKGLARARVDLFGAEEEERRRKLQEEEDRARQKEREKVVWDGHTASKVATQDRFSTSVNFDEQIAAIMRSKGLGPQDANAMGPGIGTAAAPAPLATLPPAPSSLPAPPHTAAAAAGYNAATVSSGPQPASSFPPPNAISPPVPMGMPGGIPGGMMPPGMPMPGGVPGQPVMLPPLHFQGNAFGYAPPPGGGPGGPQVGQVRTADQMEGTDAPPAKRQKIAKLPGGQYYPEQHWIDMHPHPINLQVQLPDEPSKPEWKLNGQIITLADMPLTLLVSTLRDRILQQTGSALGASKIRLSYAGKMLSNVNTIASYNLEEDDVLVLSVNMKKK